jgi:hypothetical protein
MIGGFIISIYTSENKHSLLYSGIGCDNCSGLSPSWCKLIILVVILEFLPALCFYTEFIKILAAFSILSVITCKDIHFGVKREHTHPVSRLRKRVSSIGDRDPVLRLGVQ